MVSVVLTTYNRPKLLIRALESVRVQTFQPKEIILVDDSSDKNATDFIKKCLSDVLEPLITYCPCMGPNGVEYISCPCPDPIKK